MELNQLFNIKAGFPEALNAWTIRYLEDWGQHREVYLVASSLHLAHFRNCPVNDWAAPEMGWTEPLMKAKMASETTHGLYLPHLRCIVYYAGFQELSPALQYIRRIQLRMQAFLHCNTIKGQWEGFLYLNAAHVHLLVQQFTFQAIKGHHELYEAWKEYSANVPLAVTRWSYFYAQDEKHCYRSYSLLFKAGHTKRKWKNRLKDSLCRN